jgi:hypothetical protein
VQNFIYEAPVLRFNGSEVKTHFEKIFSFFESYFSLEAGKVCFLRKEYHFNQFITLYQLNCFFSIAIDV